MSRTFTLSDNAFDALLMMMGYASGAAREAGDIALFHSFLRLANEVNKDNPQWTPYEVPDKP